MKVDTKQNDFTHRFDDSFIFVPMKMKNEYINIENNAISIFILCTSDSILIVVRFKNVSFINSFLISNTILI